MKKLLNSLILLTYLSIGLLYVFGSAGTAKASASLYVSSSGDVEIGQNITLTVRVTTGGQSANAFEGTLSYPSSMFSPVRGSFSGSICTLPITQPDPSGGSASFSCGTPSGYSGDGLVATVVLNAIASGSGSIGLSGCSVLANDGMGTAITGGCSGTSVSIAAPTPVPTPVPTVAPTARTTVNTPTPTNSKTTTVKPTQTPKPAETPKATAAPTPTPTPPPVQSLPPTTPTPAVSAANSPSASATPAATTEKRSVSTAFRDMFDSFKNFKFSTSDTSGVIATLLALIPFLIIVLVIVFLIYRMIIMERRRKRMMDRLFEMELGELASLEGKMDILAEKGSKGREEYREEFQKAKQNILSQLRPDYNKPDETLKKEAIKPEETPTEK